MANDVKALLDRISRAECETLIQSDDAALLKTLKKAGRAHAAPSADREMREADSSPRRDATPPE